MIRNKKILVTGGTGFLGGWLLTDSMCRTNDVYSVGSHDYDLTSQNETFELFLKVNPDIVIHLGADVGGIGYNRKNPGKLFYNNMQMGLNVVEASRFAKVEKLLVVGTVCGYPKYTPVPFKEENLFNGYPEETNAPYGIAKRSMAVMLDGYRKQYGLNGIYLLLVNIYGEYDHFSGEDNHVIPALISRFYQAKKDNQPYIKLWGTGKASREFLYVQDAVRAVILALNFYDKSEPVNIGAGYELTIKELAEKIKDYIGYTGEIIWDKSKPDGQPRRCLDISKAQAQFGFTAHTGIDVGLKKTIDWYVRNMRNG
jgi:GDP-L-fucose synthase